MIDIDIEFRKGVLFVRLVGKLTKEANIKFKEELITLINRSGICNIVINLENVVDIDNLGLDTLFLLKNLVEKNDGHFVICNMPLKIERLIEKRNRSLYLFKTQNELTALNAFNI